MLSPPPNGNCFRARRAVGRPRLGATPDPLASARLERWTAALAELQTLQEEYET